MARASAAGVVAGEAFWRLSMISDLQKGLRMARSQVNAFATSIENIGRRMLAIGGAILSPFATFASAAAESESVLKRLRTVYRGMADDAIAFSEAFARSIRRAPIDIQRSMTSFQTFFTGTGFTAQTSAKMSKAMTQLAADFGAFEGLVDDDALRRFISAMSGSSEVLDLFGINTKEAQIKLELLNQGFNVSSQEATEAQKQIARMATIFQALKNQGAIGFATEALGLLKNMFQQAKAALLEFRIEMGKAVMHDIKRLLGALARLIRMGTEYAKKNQELVRQTAIFGATLTVVGTAIIGVASAVKLLGFAFGWMIPIVGILTTAIKGLGKAVALLGAMNLFASATAAIGLGFGLTMSGIGVPGILIGLAAITLAGLGAYEGIKVFWEYLKNVVANQAQSVIGKINKEFQKLLPYELRDKQDDPMMNAILGYQRDQAKAAREREMEEALAAARSEQMRAATGPGFGVTTTFDPIVAARGLTLDSAEDKTAANTKRAADTLDEINANIQFGALPAS